MRPGKHVAWRTGQVLAPEDRRRIEDKIAFGTGIDGRGPMLRSRAPLTRRPFSYNLQPGNIHLRITMIFPANQSGDAISFLHAGPVEDPMLRFGANPIATSVHGIDVSSAHQIPFVRPTMRKRAVFLL